MIPYFSNGGFRMRDLVIETEDGPVVVSVDYDGPSRCIDFDKLDAELELIGKECTSSSSLEPAEFSCEPWTNTELGAFIESIEV